MSTHTPAPLLTEPPLGTTVEGAATRIRTLRSLVCNQFLQIWSGLETAFGKDTFARVLFQFVLAVVAGSYLSHAFSQQREQENRRLALAEERSEQREQLLETVSKAVYSRLFAMQLVYWEMTLHNELSEERQKLLKDKYEGYAVKLGEWNATYPVYEKALQRHFRGGDKYLGAAAKSATPAEGKTIGIGALTTEQLQPALKSFHGKLKRGRDKRLVEASLLTEKEIEDLETEYAQVLTIVNNYVNTLHDVAWAMDSK